MAMTEEIADLIARLKNGDVEFYTRFQEEEWGCRYLGNGKFLRWTRNYMENRESADEMSESGLSALFSMINAKNFRYLRLRPQRYLLDENTRTKSLQKLCAGSDDSERSTPLSEKIALAIQTPLNELSVEQLRMLLVQRKWPDYCIPLALEILQCSIFASGDMYEADLLFNVLREDTPFWQNNTVCRAILCDLIEKSMDAIMANDQISHVRKELLANYNRIKACEISTQ